MDLVHQLTTSPHCNFVNETSPGALIIDPLLVEHPLEDSVSTLTRRTQEMVINGEEDQS